MSRDPAGEAFMRLLRGISALFILASATGATAQEFHAPPAPEISDPGPAGTRISDGRVYANYFPAAGVGPHPAILLLSGSEGGLGSLTKNMATALAGDGFSVLQLCYFGCPGLPQKLVGVPLETFSDALAWMRRQQGIDGARIGILTRSRNGWPLIQDPPPWSSNIPMRGMRSSARRSIRPVRITSTWDRSAERLRE